jgi:hypothetical protein
LAKAGIRAATILDASICALRTAGKQAFKAAFVSVLQRAQHLRLSKVGTVSVDATKLQANASKHKSAPNGASHLI